MEATLFVRKEIPNSNPQVSLNSYCTGIVSQNYDFLFHLTLLKKVCYYYQSLLLCRKKGILSTHFDLTLEFLKEASLVLDFTASVFSLYSACA